MFYGPATAVRFLLYRARNGIAGEDFPRYQEYALRTAIVRRIIPTEVKHVGAFASRPYSTFLSRYFSPTRRTTRVFRASRASHNIPAGHFLLSVIYKGNLTGRLLRRIARVINVSPRFIAFLYAVIS